MLQVLVHKMVCGGEVKVIGAVPETVLRAKDSRGERFMPRAEKDGRWTEGMSDRAAPCGSTWQRQAQEDTCWRVSRATGRTCGSAGGQEDPAYVGGGLCGASEWFGGLGLKTTGGRFGWFGPQNQHGRFTDLGLKIRKRLPGGNGRHVAASGVLRCSEACGVAARWLTQEENPKLGRSANARRLAYSLG